MEASKFRQVLGQYPTGVAVVTALSAVGEPIGMTVGSFTSVSLNPPLVAFLPDRSSSSWKALHQSGNSFCVNVLGSSQENVCRAVATRKEEKFAGIPWRLSAGGNPIIEGAVAFIDCTIEDIHDAGDHQIVVGRVLELDVQNAAYPLLFFRGGYGSFTPLSLAAGDADLLEQLRLIDLVREHMERLAAYFGTEVTAITLVRNELVLAASAGHAASAVAPTRVGQRVPFIPPLGSVYAAWGGEKVREHWIDQLDESTPHAQVEAFRAMADRVRERGHAITLGHALSARLETVSTHLQAGDPAVTQATMREVIRDVADCYNPETLGQDGHYELRSLTAPVFGASGQVAFTLTLWGPPGIVGWDDLDEYTRLLHQTASAATAAIGGVKP